MNNCEETRLVKLHLVSKLWFNKIALTQSCKWNNNPLHLSMSSLEAIKNTLSAHKKHLFDRYSLTNIAVFGSYVRNQQTAESDIDILVDYNQPIGAEFIDLAEELEQILSMKVDLVSKRGLKDRQFRAIENELSYV